MTKINWTEWQKALETVAFRKPDVIPDGWITPQQLAEEEKCGITSARSMLRELVKEKRAEVKKFRVQAGESGVIRVINHYKLK